MVSSLSCFSQATSGNSNEISGVSPNQDRAPATFTYVIAGTIPNFVLTFPASVEVSKSGQSFPFSYRGQLQDDKKLIVSNYPDGTDQPSSNYVHLSTVAQDKLDIEFKTIDSGNNTATLKTTGVIAELVNGAKQGELKNLMDPIVIVYDSAAIPAGHYEGVTVFKVSLESYSAV